MKKEEECFNCCQPFYNEEDRVFEISVDLMDDPSNLSKVKVETVLSSLYNLHLLNRFKDQMENPEEDDMVNVALCLSCSAALSDFYKFYTKFQQLCHLDSHLTRRIQRLGLLMEQLEVKSSHTTGPTCDVSNGPWVKLVRLTPEEITTAVNWESRDIYEEEENNEDPISNMTGFDDDPYKEEVEDPLCIPNKLAVHKCDNCSKEFVRAQNLKSHQRICHLKKNRNSSKRYSCPSLPATVLCPLCDEKFTKPKEVTEHLLSTHVHEGGRVCPLCPLEVRPSEMKKHLRNHSNQMRQCLTCGKRFSTNYKMLRHMHSHLDSVINDEHVKFRCDKCDRGYYFPSLLREHMESAHPSNTDNANIVTQPRRRQGGRYSKSKCTICDKTVLLFGEETLETHMETCRGKKCHACPICQRMCTKKYLRLHLKTHGPPQGHFECSICSKVLQSASSLKIHAKVHSGEREFPCTICGLSFTQAGNLRGHLRFVHFKDKPFLCTLCGASFGRSYGLKRHMLGHGEERTFKCRVEGCDKSYKSSETMKKHERVHDVNLNQSLCTFCGKQVNQDSMRRHVLTHTGEKSKKCPHLNCGMAFIDNRQLNRHIRKKHNNNLVDPDCNDEEFLRDGDFLGL